MPRFIFSALLILAFFWGRAQNDSLRRVEIGLANDSMLQSGNRGAYDSALVFARRLESLVLARDTGYCAMVCYEEAEFSRLLDQQTEALYYFTRARDLYRHLSQNDPLARAYYAYTLSRIGWCYGARGDATDHETYLTEALPLFLSSDLMGDYAQTLLVLGTMHCARGDYAGAIDMETRAGDILDTLHGSSFNVYLRLSNYGNEAALHYETGNRPKALSDARSSLTLLQRADTTDRALRDALSEEYVPVLLNAADLYLSYGLDDSAGVELQLAETMLPRWYSTDAKAQLLQEEATFARHKGRMTQAIDLLRDCIRFCDTLPLKPETYDITWVTLGSFYNQEGKYREADSIFRGVITRLRQQGLNYSYTQQQAMSGLCISLLDRGLYAEAADSLLVLSRLSLASMDQNFPGMSEADQLLYKQGLEGVSDLLYTCLLHKYKRDVLRETYALELQQKNAVLIDEAGNLERARHSGDTVLSETYRAWLGNRQVLSQQYALPYDQRRYRTDSLEAINETLEARLSARGGPARGASKIPRLAPASASVEFIRFRPGARDSAVYAAFVLRSGDTTPIFVRLCSETALRRLLEDAHGRRIDDDQLTRKLYDPRSSGSRNLYHLVWQPLEPYLAKTRDVYYSSAGLLCNIAFHAVYTGTGYLGTRFGLHRCLSLTDRPATTGERPGAIQVWGNIDYDTEGPMQSLGAAEVNRLKGVFRNLPFTSYEGAAATEENFKQEAAATQGILHISTHGFYTPFDQEMAGAATPGGFIAATVNPLFRCGLAFAGANYYWIKGVPRGNHDDGILTGYEIEQLDLHRVQLVTLSACETGLGDVTDNEGTLGLQRAFRLAGVRRLLVSLWQVPARQTAELLSLFYEKWLDGQGPGEALRTAENTLRQRGYPPYYWAGFVLIE